MGSEVEEIKARIDAVDLVSEYIRLKQMGGNWKGLCPFHNEKTPSFMVSRDKQIWHCFGCGQGGDVFSFVQQIEGVEFPEALKLLAQKAGVKLSLNNPKVASEKNRLLEVCRLAKLYWHKILTDLPQAQATREYLKQRGVSEASIESFALGYAPDSWEALSSFLIKRGFSEKEIFLAGLSVKKERGSGFYDRFRNRLIFPIDDIHGNTIGFSARTMDKGETGAKYINTPQTAVYNKSVALFNLHRAKLAIKKENLAIVVEGQMDALSAYQAGSHNVIASSGTALTLEQIKILKRYTNTIALAFDADIAGQSAADRGIDIALSEDMNVRVIVLPSGKDPDECIRQNSTDWFEAVKKSKSILEYYFEKTFKDKDLAKVETKKQAAEVLLPVIFKISNKIEQTHWLQKLSSTLNVPENILRETAMKSAVKRPEREASETKTAPKSRTQQLSEQLLGLVMKYPSELRRLIDNLPPEIILIEYLQDLYKKLIIYYTKEVDGAHKNFDYREFQQTLDDEKNRYLADVLVLAIEKDFFNFDESDAGKEIDSLILFIKKHYYSVKQTELQAEIQRAEQRGDTKQATELISKFNELIIRSKTL